MSSPYNGVRKPKGDGDLITELEALTGKTVQVKSDPALHQEMFDIH